MLWYKKQKKVAKNNITIGNNFGKELYNYQVEIPYKENSWNKYLTYRQICHTVTNVNILKKCPCDNS